MAKSEIRAAIRPRCVFSFSGGRDQARPRLGLWWQARAGPRRKSTSMGVGQPC